MKSLPIYKALVSSEEDGMFCVSLVDQPAIEKDFVAFEKQEPVKLSIEDEEQQMVFGPVMIPNMLIYRRNAEGFEYYIMYEADTIHQMAEKFFAERRTNDVDTDHNFELEPGVVMTQAFFKNVEKGINPAGYEDLPDDTLFFQYHITNQEVWDKVKSGEFKGFSLAGLFTVEPVNNEKEDTKMSKLNSIKASLAEALLALAKVTTNKGILSYDGDELEVGIAVYIVDEEGNESKPEDGDYETDTQVIKVEDGRITEINEIEKVDEPGEPQEEVEASAEPAEGPEAEVEAQKEVPAARAIGLAFEATYDEKYRAIAAAVAGLGFDGYVVEAADSYCVICTWNEELGSYDKHYRFDISWEGDEAHLSNMIEVVEEYVPVDENRSEIIENLRSEVETLKSQLAEPAAKPAEIQFREAQGLTGDKKYDKIINIFSR